MKYEVHFLEGVPFEVELGKYPYEILPRASTVLVKTIDDKLETREQRYGFVLREEIYSQIETGQIINLNHCYLAGFSLEEYKKKINVNNYNVLITLNGANCTFFDTRESLERAIGRELYSAKYVPDYEDEKPISVNFSGAQFGVGKVAFYEAKFGDGDVDFIGAQFGDGNVDFTRAEFGDGDVSFSGAQFGNGNVDFDRTRFGDGDVSFIRAKFGDGVVSFREARFGYGIVNFPSIDIDRRKGNGVIGATIEFSCYFQDHVDMQNTKCKDLIFKNCMIEKTLNLEGLDVKKLSFEKTKNLGLILIKWKEDKVAERLEADLDQEKANQVVMLKENFHTIGRYDDEDLAYVMYKRCKWKVIYNELLKMKRKPHLILCHYLKKIAYDWISEYGTNYIRVVMSMITIWAVFTSIYLLFPGMLYRTSDLSQPNVRECISYSIATLLTIGYGNITPLTWGAVILSGLEGFLGVFLTAYFAVAFARNVLR
ncbi:potassium channel family protein [Desulfosporosinus nitroreducens]|uniref:Potassium channel family protein n=1 Tax=Desulfosporosinus nitroreducens TaxID=2018668 RepID=A0ABT8QWF5_9FIRM|nr:potassium channel family protein [Desulfosporosinus nitroreducens]MDO0824970.1 potassium channel family protein [Desulfosporosinus nitroreducens]